MNKSKVASVPEFSLPVRVYFQDTDAGGVVYHANYLNFMERARTEWLRTHGYSNAGLMNEFGVVFVVRSLKIDYLKPAQLDDMLNVTAKIKEIGRSRVTLLQTVRRLNGIEVQSGRKPTQSHDTHGGRVVAEVSEGQRNEEVMVEAEVHLVSVSVESFKPVSVPEVLRNQWKDQMAWK